MPCCGQPCSQLQFRVLLHIKVFPRASLETTIKHSCTLSAHLFCAGVFFFFLFARRAWYLLGGDQEVDSRFIWGAKEDPTPPFLADEIWRVENMKF